MIDDECRIEYRRGPEGDRRWVCLTHDVEVVPVLPDAYIHHPTAKDFACPIHIETRKVPR